MPPLSPPTVWRSPRLRYVLPEQEVEIAAPPAVPNPPSAIVRTLLPALISVSVMAVLATFVLPPGTGSSMLMFSAPLMLASSVGAVIFYLTDKRKHKQAMAEREEEYQNHLAQAKKHLEELDQYQQRVLVLENPSPAECLKMTSHDRLSRRLWTRRPSDDDFLALRIGIGNRPTRVEVKAPDQQSIFAPDALIEQAQAIAKAHRTLPGAPMTVPLQEVGALGLAGPQEDCYATARALVVQLATHHSPDEVKLAALYPSHQSALWDWLRWLPHVWSDDRKHRYLACNASSAKALLSFYGDLIDRRAALWAEKKQEPDAQPNFGARHVILLGAKDLTASEPAMARLMTEGPQVGIYPIILREHYRELDNTCDYGIRVGLQEPIFGPMEGMRSAFAPDSVDLGLARRFALSMAPLRLISQARLSEIPSFVPLLDVLGASDLKGLNLMSRWQASRSALRSLAAPIGLREGGEPLMFDLHERAHGPNGLVAGMVGAGKSELLQTMVASIAANYHPHQVAFVLIDYKGGGMADPFIGLPHTLGTIDNLQDEALARRAVTSLKVELDRRLRLFQEAGVNHINKYQQLYNQGAASIPLPYLVVIVDEFAELKTEQPEVAQEFVRIARLGRAPGICLILAMQKPSGIVDGQIEGNTRFRLCLRVAQVDDSRAMLGRPEAAYVTGVGRAYFQVGVNEQFSLFQVAYGGAPYAEASNQDDEDLEIRAINLNGQAEILDLPLTEAEKTERQERAAHAHIKTQLQAVVEAMIEAAQAHQIVPLHSPWLPPLPETVSLDAILSGQAWDADCLEMCALDDVTAQERMLEPGGWDGHQWQPSHGWIQPIVGLVDDPDQQAQYPLEIDLAESGHLAVFGAPGYGKTVFLQTLLTSLVRTYAPNDVQIYVLDFGGRILAPFEALPHVGAVISAEETDRLQRLLKHLVHEIQHRKEALGRAGASRLEEYRRSSNKPMPALVVALDSWGTFHSLHGENETIMNSVTQILREGSSLGIHLVLTANASSDLNYRLRNHIDLVMALHLVDDMEHGQLMGRLNSLVIDDTPGRALIKTTPVHGVQIALAAEGDSDMDRGDALTQMFTSMDGAWLGLRPTPFPATPECVVLSELVEKALASETQQASYSTPVGISTDDLTHLAYRPWASPLLFVTGEHGAGRTTLLRSILLGWGHLVQTRDPHVYIIDSQRGGLADLAHLPCVAGYAATSDQADALATQLDQDIAKRMELGSAMLQADGLPPLVLVIDDYLDSFEDSTSATFKSEKLKLLMRNGRNVGLSVVVSTPYEAMGKYGGLGGLADLKTAVGRADGVMLGLYREDVLSEVDSLLRGVNYHERQRRLPAGLGYWSVGGGVCRAMLALPDIEPSLAQAADKELQGSQDHLSTSASEEVSC